jgi:cell division septum initiation protein DivIVA
VSVEDRLADVRRLVEEARTMPMSASVMVNRDDLLTRLAALEAEVRQALAEAEQVTADKDGVVDEGRREAEGLLASARDEQQRLASETEVLRTAQEQADTQVDDARREADALREEADAYVDHKLAGFEVALERTLETVRRGRERLASRESTGRRVDPDAEAAPAQEDGSPDDGGFW